MRLLTLSTLLVLLGAVAACSGDNGDDAYRQAAEQAVREAVLTLDDLPGGWTNSDVSGAYADLELSGNCSRLNGRGAGFPDEVASRDSDSFTGPSGQELASTVSAFTSPETAAAALQLADDLVHQCTDQLEEALKRAIRNAAADRNLDRLLDDIDAVVEAAGFTALGDETAAYRLKADFSALVFDYEVNGHIIVIRDGALTGVLLYAVLGDLDEEDELSVAAALAGKLRKAEESLVD